MTSKQKTLLRLIREQAGIEKKSEFETSLNALADRFEKNEITEADCTAEFERISKELNGHLLTRHNEISNRRQRK